ncbi:MAG: hypothetical protein H7Y07_11425 [Pyrinomonadaceae bacterium]|nr:hypothetical protein [Sphingobacteriaceae bacterium]
MKIENRNEYDFAIRLYEELKKEAKALSKKELAILIADYEKENFRNLDDLETELTDFLWHEALDRTFIVADSIEKLLLAHLVFLQDQLLWDKVEKAQALLLEVYQEIGSR